MNEQDIPIDIHTNKLSDWLVSRRHCNKEWQKNILQIREKINNAIQDMPAHDGIVKLLTGAFINYFHCVKIIEILKETEADTKNLFGRYGSQRMRDWQEIVKLYERDNIYLAEAAQMLTRNITYEIPSLKKQIIKLEQVQKECDKREKEYMKTEKTVRGEFNTLCKQLGIKGVHIKKELVEMLSELPTIYKEVSKTIKTTKSAVELYNAFVEFTSGKQETGRLSLLTYVIDHGNTTTYEWTYGEAPVTIEEPQINIDIEEKKEEHGDTIDFGDDHNEIDFGAVEEEIDFGEDNIDWGAGDASEEVNDAGEIDFNISLEESGIVVEDAGIEGGIARGNDALTLLDNPNTRGKITDDLMELESFLKMRLYELTSVESMNIYSHSQDAESSILQMQTPETITTLLGKIQGALASITSNRVQHLHNIKHSPRYVDYLTSTLQQKLNVVDKMVSSQKAVQGRREEAIQQAVNLEKVLKVIIEKTKVLQEQIEEDISKRYKNRQVNLMGGINS